MVSIRAIFNCLSKSTARDSIILSSSSSLARAFGSDGDGSLLSREAASDHLSKEENEDSNHSSDHNSSNVPFLRNNRLHDLSESSQEKIAVGLGNAKEFPEENFIEKLKIGVQKSKKILQDSPQPEDADEIFKKMKETGLIPNAVAMLDGLCKNGYVHEAMNLFAIMRQKGILPEVVIYTAALEGFCAAQKLDHAKRIFKKMKNNGISPNAFTYFVLIQGLCRGDYNNLMEAAGFCGEMIEKGFNPNLDTYVGLVDRFCVLKGGGVEAAQKFIQSLAQKGYFVNEKTLRDFLDKNEQNFSPFLQEAIFMKKNPLQDS